MDNNQTYCPYCGSPHISGAKFCTQCGAALNPTSEQQPNETAQNNQSYSTYSSNSSSSNTDPLKSKTDLGYGFSIAALVFSLTGSFLYLIFGILGLVFANQGDHDNPKYRTSLILAWCALGIGTLVFVLSIIYILNFTNIFASLWNR